MARAPWQPREGETEEECETRLAADAVHRRLEQARQRELEEAYWRSRATSSAPDADSFERNIVAARSATPRATLAGVSDAAPSTRGDGSGGLMSDLEVQELARAASRVGATPDVSRRVAEEVLAAERVAVDAAMRRASTHRPRSSARGSAAGALPRASTPPRPRAAALGTPAGAAAASRRDAEESAEVAPASAPAPRRFRADDDDDDASAGMTSALWQMARTPGLAKPRTTTRTTMRHLVSEAPSFAPRRPNVNESEENERVAKAAASRARGLFGGGDPDSSRRARAAFSQAAAAAVEDGLRKLVARANETPKSHKTGSRSAGKSFRKNAAVSARDDDGARSPVVSFRDDEKTNNRRVSPRSRRDSHHTSPPAWPVRDPTNCVSPPASLTSSDDEHRTEAWLSAAAFPLEEGAEDDGEDNARGALWLEDDLRAVRAAHDVARRAEDATARLEADERAARLATAAAVARLLDARVALAAATARAVSEEAATSAALCAAEAASARLTLDDEVGPSGDRGVGTCEALAEALSAPLPNVGGVKRQP
jgi:hypothetical protein